ncbi:guanine nucleotide-binding protein subunit beta 1 [Cichlidogyrus casuarinus]|uniref:Guanine nucleotide-binding protein subunit beta 1 n=1 Tax=Cichlidogyrus casuarinus TaxID=1844966 RepID=A0ABD2QET0_9PLAT
MDFGSPAAKKDDDDMRCEKEHKLLKEIAALKLRLKDERKKVADTDFYKKTEKIEELGRLKFKNRKHLRGHLTKVTDIQWARNSHLMVSAAQDGKLIVWETETANKLHMIQLSTAWVMSCAFAPSHNFVASGGLDNNISIFNLNKPENQLQKNISGHGGYVGCLRYLADDSRLLSSSGDKSTALWDTETGQITQRFLGHENDVTAIATPKSEWNNFVSVSSDKTCRMWDIRTGMCTQYFDGHEQDVNGVEFFPCSAYAFATSSDDGSCRLWDIRADQAIAVYVDEYITCGSTSVTLSKSGRLLIGGYDDFNCHVWDLLREERVSIMSAHDGRVSAASVSDDGRAVATASWDTTCLIWTAKS